MNKYYKNFIICGNTNFHCLLCQENFHSLLDVEKHIRWENHRKILKTQTCAPKFAKEFVYKVGNFFYCEPCNLLIENENITAHTKENIHKANKSKPKTDAEIENEICKYDCGYILISDLILTKQQWHCIENQYCLLCDTPIENVDTHIGTTEHVLKIINTKVSRESGGTFFRKINSYIFYCFTCRKAFPIANIDDHWSDMQHLINQTDTMGRTTASNVNECKKNELQQKLIDSQKNFFNIFWKTGEAVCKECKRSFILDYKVMLNHQKTHASNPSSQRSKLEVVEEGVHESSSEEGSDEVIFSAVKDSGKRRAELAIYGRNHFIKLNPGASRAYCIMCHANLCSSLKLIKQHVKGLRHKFNLEMKGFRNKKEHKIPNFKSKSLTNDLKSLFYSDKMKIMWVNQQIYLDRKSFILASPVIENPHFRMTKCFSCDTLFPIGHENEHYTTDEHKKKYLASKVLSIQKEYVREVRPDVFHCGTCNIVFPYWELMERHLLSLNHLKRRKNKELLTTIAAKYFEDKEVMETSLNPDVLYMQLVDIGVLF